MKNVLTGSFAYLPNSAIENDTKILVGDSYDILSMRPYDREPLFVGNLKTPIFKKITLLIITYFQITIFVRKG